MADQMDTELGLFSVGDSVQAFHPRMFGVVRSGTVTKVGRKWLHIDFGPLLGGVIRVSPNDVVTLDRAQS